MCAGQKKVATITKRLQDNQCEEEQQKARMLVDTFFLQFDKTRFECHNPAGYQGNRKYAEKESEVWSEKGMTFSQAGVKYQTRLTRQKGCARRCDENVRDDRISYAIPTITNCNKCFTNKGNEKISPLRWILPPATSKNKSVPQKNVTY